jgi:hypothetical protein
MRFFIGPMSKNIVDEVIRFANDTDTDMVLIPSRRQVDWNGGYVNNWTTEEFVNYVRSRTSKVLIERDHGGPGQGSFDDDGLDSIEHDARLMDIIHVDPWKKYPDFDQGLAWTVQLITFSYKINKNILFEVGTEEGIRKFEVDELELFVKELKNRLTPEVFSRIRYLVIQCGTRLAEKENTGVFDDQKLRNMIALAAKYSLVAKEHNGDWVSPDVVRAKEACGLQNINIAPEFGELETRVILDRVRGTDLFEKFFDLCYCSGKWVKWVSPSFDPMANKEKTILISGHYVFSVPEFIKIKQKIHGIDEEISAALRAKLLKI